MQDLNIFKINNQVEILRLFHQTSYTLNHNIYQIQFTINILNLKNPLKMKKERVYSGLLNFTKSQASKTQ
jgi:hypothetical protein